MKFYNPKNKEEVGIWDNQAILEYQILRIQLEYETEPPHGDFIYSIKLAFDNGEMDIFPFWIYGRSILLFDNYVVLESMEIGSYKNLRSMIIDIDTKQYTILDHWYNDYAIENDLLILLNTFYNKKLVIPEIETDLLWFPIFL
jgi:hypothetical protein